MRAFDFPIIHVARVIDGDTYVLRLDLGFRLEAEMVFRLYGFDTPELRSRKKTDEAREQERALAKKARIFAMDWFDWHADVQRDCHLRTLTYKDPDNFGRWLATPYCTCSASLGHELHREGLAKVYEK